MCSQYYLYMIDILWVVAGLSPTATHKIMINWGNIVCFMRVVLLYTSVLTILLLLGWHLVNKSRVSSRRYSQNCNHIDAILHVLWGVVLSYTSMLTILPLHGWHFVSSSWAYTSCYLQNDNQSYRGNIACYIRFWVFLWQYAYNITSTYFKFCE